MKYSLVLASYYLVSPTMALHLPFTRRTPQTSQELYRGAAQMPGKDVPINLDTGSTDLWLYNYTKGLLDSAVIHPDLFITDSYGK
ncbi:hypothetical protein BDV93DRAFT_605961, partial [Ceratobasidium sp. AG-I]